MIKIACKKTIGFGNILLLLFVFSAISELYGGASSDQPIPWDNHGEIEYRQPPSEQIEHYKNNPLYNYHRDVERPGFFSRLWNMLWREIFSGMQQEGWVKYAFLIIVIAGFGYLLFRMFDLPFTGMFNLSDKTNASGLILSDSESVTDETELNNMFQLYRSNGAFREAIRVLYLIYLIKMDRHGYIIRRTWKTNREYAREINDPEKQKLFRKLSQIYEHVWFGQFEPEPVQFEKIELTFQNIIASCK